MSDPTFDAIRSKEMFFLSVFIFKIGFDMTNLLGLQVLIDQLGLFAGDKELVTLLFVPS